MRKITGDPRSGGQPESHHKRKCHGDNEGCRHAVAYKRVSISGRQYRGCRNDCTQADNAKRGADVLSLKDLPTRTNDDIKGGNEEHNPFIHAKLKYPDKGEQDSMLDQMEAINVHQDKDKRRQNKWHRLFFPSRTSDVAIQRIRSTFSTNHGD